MMTYTTQQRHARTRSLGRFGAVLAPSVLGLLCGSGVHAQGILTVTPGRTLATAAGNGRAAFSGDSRPAISASLANPSAIAYDPSGNLYVADAQNHIVREIHKSGTIITIAGTGVASFGGDGGPATSAFLDTPTGIAIDSSGDLFIADSHNHRIRMVANGTITTIAGTGTPAFTGDNGPATSASLDLPSAVALDAANNLYIADSLNQRIRKVSGTTITTIAGNGEELYAGDGAAATLASLDQPTGLAIDPVGRLYIADRHNHRIRMVDTNGIISTVGGSGTVNFSGGFAGDGSSATSATLARPSGVFTDTSGNIFIADTDNQRIRQITNGAIATIAGTGEQGFAGDGGPAVTGIFNSPRALATGPSGNLLIADTLNQRLRNAALPTLSFSSPFVGVPGQTQPITLANTGTAPLTISSLTLSGPFLPAAGGTCGPAPLTLAPGATCTQDVSFVPVAMGAVSGSLVISGSGLIPATILFSGSSAPAPTTLTLTSSLAAPLIGQPITFTAIITPPGTGTPTGTIIFFDGSVALAAPQPLASATASLTISTLAAGTHSITATYSGDPNFDGSASAALAQTVQDFNFTINPSSSPSQTVLPGQAATFAFTVQPLAASFSYPVVLSATGLPPGATATFTPPTINLGLSPTSFQMTIQTATIATLLRNPTAFTGTASIALLLLPFTAHLRRRSARLRPVWLGCLLFLGIAGTGAITGCSTRPGFFGQAQKTYTVNVVATATGAGGATLQHLTSVTLTVQ